MPSKQGIIDNVDVLSSDELFNYINSGIVTFDELCEKSYDFSDEKKGKVLALLRQREEDAWEGALRYSTEESILAFMQKYPESEHRQEARKLLRDIEEQRARQAEEDEWNALDKNDEEALKKFERDHKSSPHARDARRMIARMQRAALQSFDINSLKKKIEDIETSKRIQDKSAKIFEVVKEYIDNEKITSEELINAIAKDNNLLSASVIYDLIDEAYLLPENLIDIDIPEEVIQKLNARVATNPFPPSRELTQIQKKGTEVYFWGIPSSGKSCALGAILSVANNGKIARSMRKDNDCQGYGYMTRLSELFKSNGSVGTMPPGTETDAFYEMGFDLEDPKGNMHPIICVDLAGELVKCMYRKDADESLSVKQDKTLETVTKILIDNRTQNRKIHFFVIEYGGENLLYDGLSQSVYLDGALRYIERTSIFKENTDAIYLMFTKVDKINAVGEELTKALAEYTEKHYKGFFQGLERICREYEINGGKVERIPFTLGKVYFQDYCIFEEGAAGNVVKKFLIRSKGFETGIIGKLKNLLKK